MLPNWPPDGDAWVIVGSKRFAAAAVLIMALAVSACANPNFDTSGSWFSKPLDLFGSRAGYTYSNLNDNSSRERPLTVNDLVDANGACPAAQAPPPVPQQAAPATADASSVPAGDLASMLGGNIAIGMSECDVVQRLGQPNSVNLGTNPNGLRGAILTYSGGSRPGLYRFEAGRLTEMDRVEQPPAQAEQKPPVKKKIVKKKPTVPEQPAKSNGSG